MPAPKTVRMESRPCGACRRMLKRVFYTDGRKHDENQVYSRTLVWGEFLPSCSKECLEKLRLAAGLNPKGVAA